MRRNGPQPGHKGLLGCACLGMAAFMTKGMSIGDPVTLIAIAIMGLFGIISFIGMIIDFFAIALNLLLIRKAMRPEKIHGSSTFAREKDLRK